MKFRYGLCSLQIFNAILFRFSRRLRNSPRPWVILVIHKIWLRFQHIYYDRLFEHCHLIRNMLLSLVHIMILILCNHILPFRRADLTAPASLQGIRGEGPQLHTLRLESAAISTREYTRITFIYPKAKSSISPRPHLNFIRFIQPRLVNKPGYLA